MTVKSNSKFVELYELKEATNEFHNALSKENKTIKEKFISNPNKEYLQSDDIDEMLNDVVKLETLIPNIKHLLFSRKLMLLISQKRG